MSTHHREDPIVLGLRDRYDALVGEVERLNQLAVDIDREDGIPWPKLADAETARDDFGAMLRDMGLSLIVNEVHDTRAAIAAQARAEAAERRRVKAEQRRLQALTSDLLDQDEVWVDRQRRTLRVASMHPDYRRNVQRLLRRNALSIATKRFLASESNAPIFNFRSPFDQYGFILPSYPMTAELRRATGNPTAAENWIESTKLVRKLVEMDGDLRVWPRDQASMRRSPPPSERRATWTSIWSSAVTTSS